MKHGVVIGGFAAAWVTMVVLLFWLHWRPAKTLLPVISVILLIYVTACAVTAVSQWLKHKK